LAKKPEERFSSVQEFVEALAQAYLRPPASSRPLLDKRLHARKRTQRALLRETAGLLTASCVIGSALGFILSVLGLELKGFWLLLMLMLMAIPLLVALHMRNGMGFLLASGIVVVSTMFGSVFHSALLFLSVYAILSFVMIVVTFSLSIQDKVSTR
jgi:hypothetical protein